MLLKYTLRMRFISRKSFEEKPVVKQKGNVIHRRNIVSISVRHMTGEGIRKANCNAPKHNYVVRSLTITAIGVSSLQFHFTHF